MDTTALGQVYDQAIKDASDEELLEAWESARRGPADFEIGSDGSW